ncbi:MAG: VWA domain-containing protein [Syntrophorhabdaceae bacterium]|nr:VWA domain-containing protein [Syntrophorhabdaceae bacterium]
MKANLTELVFIIDRSGSMGGLESDTIGGFNSMLAKQQTEPGECRITTVLFDDKYEILHDRIDTKAVSPLTEKEYFVRGTTALLDAVGKTIHKIINVQKRTAPGRRAEKVVFIITTDGMENASREFGYGKVKSLIKQQKSRYGWEFVFLGADIDAVDVADRIGIGRNRAQNYSKDRKGIALNYKVLSDTVAAFRAAPQGAALCDDWSAEIEADYRQRG